jgi:hypothetical protein
MTQSPAQCALDLIREYIGHLGTVPAIVVEGGYIDPTDRAGDRVQHAIDSGWLVEQLIAVPAAPWASILWTSLVNDFEYPSRYCGVDVCPEPSELSPDEVSSSRAAAALARVPPAIPTESFTMRSTRNRAGERVRRLVKAPPALAGVREELDGDMIDIYAATRDGEVFLGCWKDKDRRRLAVRCTALMAQHYFDIFKRVRRDLAGLTDLWIVDFNRYLERDRVRLGAQAAEILNPWPPDLKVTIVNCVYFSTPGTTPIQVTQWP